jgi:hypothetical protein
MDDDDTEMEMLDDAFMGAVAGIRYEADGTPRVSYSGVALMDLHMMLGFGESEAYEEIDSWRGSGIDVIWPLNIEIEDDPRPRLTLVSKRDLH